MSITSVSVCRSLRRTLQSAVLGHVPTHDFAICIHPVTACVRIYDGFQPIAEWCSQCGSMRQREADSNDWEGWLA